VAVLAAIAFVQSPPVHAEQVMAASPSWDVAQSELCEAAILKAERQHSVPPGLLRSIARVESGRPLGEANNLRPWPWTINADGKGLFLDSKAAAVVWVSGQRWRHQYVDVGCLQVDLSFHPEAFSSVEQAFDPDANVDYAARYLLDLYRGEAGHNWNVAVGLYHSHRPMLGAEYRDRVSEMGARVLRGVLDPVPLYVRAIRQGTLRIALGAGRSTPINVKRQPAVRRRNLTSCQVARTLGSYLAGNSLAACVAPAAVTPTR
jgi:hypothetical protein